MVLLGYTLKENTLAALQTTDKQLKHTHSCSNQLWLLLCHYSMTYEGGLSEEAVVWVGTP